MTELHYNDTCRPAVGRKYRSNPAHHVVPERQKHGVQRLIAELDRDILQLGETIAAEEAATKVFSLTDVRYSFAARNMRARRDNLAITKAALLARLNLAAGRVPGGGVAR